MTERSLDKMFEILTLKVPAEDDIPQMPYRMALLRLQREVAQGALTGALKVAENSLRKAQVEGVLDLLARVRAEDQPQAALEALPQHLN